MVRVVHLYFFGRRSCDRLDKESSINSMDPHSWRPLRLGQAWRVQVSSYIRQTGSLDLAIPSTDQSLVLNDVEPLGPDQDLANHQD